MPSVIDRPLSRKRIRLLCALPSAPCTRLHLLHMTTIEAINTVPDGLNSAARHVSDRLAYVEGRRRVNWADVHRLASEAAAGLVTLGLARGERVAICAENSIDWIVAYHAIVRAGGVGVPVYYELRQREIDEQVKRPGCRSSSPRPKCWRSSPAASAVSSTSSSSAQRTRTRQSPRRWLSTPSSQGDHRIAHRGRGARTQGGRAGGHRLHLGHHRRRQGRHAQPPQLHRERLRRHSGPRLQPRDRPPRPADAPRDAVHRRRRPAAVDRRPLRHRERPAPHPRPPAGTPADDLLRRAGPVTR